MKLSELGPIGSALESVIIFGFLLLLIGISVETTKSLVHNYDLRNKLKALQTSKARYAKAGIAEFDGEAKCKNVMIAPLTGTKCAYAKLMFYHRNALLHKKPREFLTKEYNNDFYLEDDSGKIIVRPQGGEISIPEDTEYTGAFPRTIEGIPNSATEQRLIDYLEANPDIKKEFEKRKNDQFYVYEYIIEEGDPVYVLGTVESSSEGMVVKKGAEGLLYISDAPETKVHSNLTKSIYRLIAGTLTCWIITLAFGIPIAWKQLLYLLSLLGV